jgi:hypothetical protein
MNRVLILILFLFINSIVSAKIYYVAPSGGSDMNPGTNISAPFATWQRGFDVAEPGDTVYFRGGVWYTTESTYPRINPHGYVKHGNSGTPENPICFFNYPGEKPVLDCSAHVPSGGATIIHGISVAYVQYLHFRGLTIRNLYQRGNTYMPQGITFELAANITFENMVVHDISGRGAFGSEIVGYYNDAETPETIYCDTTRWINCDFYNLCDSTSANPGNAADGIKIHLNGRTSTSYPHPYWEFSGCRFWNYSDDGLDVSGDGVVKVDRCWAMSTDKYSSADIEGNGFKLGGLYHTLVPSDSTLRKNWRIVTNSMAVFCHSSGFYDLDYAPCHRTNGIYYNNTSFKNRIGFYGISGYENGWYINHPRTSVYKNNIAYENSEYEAALYRVPYPESHNTWDFTGAGTWPGWVYTDTVTVTDEDFFSVDSTGITGPRESDGSLPDLPFLKLDPATSDLINKGVYVGLPFYGAAPDIGAFECDYEAGTYNRYPSIEITSPLDGTVFKEPTAITITVNATDKDGSISKVEYIDGTKSLTEITLSPWSYTWNNVPLGNHFIRAVATDDQGAEVTSSVVKIEVRTDIFKLYPNPNTGIFTIVITEPLRESCEIKISSFDGREIYSGTMSEGELTKQFDLSNNINFKHGKYALALFSGERIIQTIIFIKE